MCRPLTTRPLRFAQTDLYSYPRQGWDGFVQDIEATTARLAQEQPVENVTDRRTGEDFEVALGPCDLKLAVYYVLGERENFPKTTRRVREFTDRDYSLLAQLAVPIRDSVMLISLSLDHPASTPGAAIAAAQINHESDLSLATRLPATLDYM